MTCLYVDVVRVCVCTRMYIDDVQVLCNIHICLLNIQKGILQVNCVRKRLKWISKRQRLANIY